MADDHMSQNAVMATHILLIESNVVRKYSIPDLRDNSIFPTLWYRIHVLVFDLENSKDRSKSKERLESMTDTSYLGEPYFNSTESDVVKNTVINGKALPEIIQENLKERLERRMKKRVDSGDYRVCAAHDLAPILATTLGIDLKQLRKDNRFKDVVEKNGLNCDERWDGLAKKSFAPTKIMKKKK